jgi:hypothetical protein
VIAVKRFAVILALTLTAAACGDHGPVAPAATAPSPVTPPSLPPPNNGASVRGTVYDTANRYIAGAIVEVVDGPQAGTSVTSDATGGFLLTGTLDDTTLFRATKEGHVSATQHWRRVGQSNQPWLGFSLDVLAPPVNIAGVYTLTFIADSACAAALPAELRTRTYSATITPFGTSNTQYRIDVSGAQFDAIYNWFSVGVAGDYLGFWLGDEHLVELLAANTSLELTGSAAASVGTSGVSTISASFDGVFRYQAARCESRNHRMILVRR